MGGGQNAALLAFLDHVRVALTAALPAIVERRATRELPGSRAAGVAEFLDRLLAVESIETQKRVTSVLGAFEREAREAQGKPWKALSAEQATALLGTIVFEDHDGATTVAAVRPLTLRAGARCASWAARSAASTSLSFSCSTNSSSSCASAALSPAARWS